MQDFHVPARKVSTCFNWVNPVFKVPTAAERDLARHALGIAPPDIVVAYLGRFAPEKRVDALLEAFADVTAGADVPVKLALFGDGWKRQTLVELTHALGLENRACFFGWASEPWRALAACDIFVLPSIVEGFPLALIEAMATGCACLAHPLPSALHLIESGTHGLLADLSVPRNFATALRSLIDCGPAERRRMGLAAATRVATDYSRARRLPKVLSALGLTVDVAPECRLRRLEFEAGPT
jgi:glycosyltransferase involved in cell wall biosynthesis